MDQRMVILNSRSRDSLIKYIFILNTERDKLIQNSLKEIQAKSRKLSNQLRKSLWQSQSQAKHHEEKTIFRCHHKQAVYL